MSLSVGLAGITVSFLMIGALYAGQNTLALFCAILTDGTQTVTGLVRVDVAAPPDANTKPITVPKTVFVTTLRNERIDVAGTDVDPAGGVLLVTGITNLPANSGVRAEVLEQRLVRVSLEAPLDHPMTFNYRISNGLAEAEGVITVIEIPTPTRVQARSPLTTA